MSSKKTVLLINPWIYDFTAYDFWLKPLGLLYIASLLQKHTDFNIHLIDCLDRHHPSLRKKLETRPDGRGPFFKQEVPKPSVLKDVPRKYSRYGIPFELFQLEMDGSPVPDIVFVTCTMTYWYPGVQVVVEMVKDRWGDVPVVLGGVYPTLIPEHANAESGADVILEGPGERKIFPLLREILGDDTCPDLCWGCLDEIPYPAFDLMRNRESLPILTSRGCPLDCSYCAGPLINKKFEQRDPMAVVNELRSIHTAFNTRHVAFYDDALLINKSRHIIPLLEEIVSRKLSFALHTPNGLHVREIDLEIAVLFKKANFQSLYLSQESFELETLLDSSSKVSPEDLSNALDHLEKAGFRKNDINIYLMVGLPGQDVDVVKRDILKVFDLGAQPRLAYFSPVPGTRDWKRLVRSGRIAADADPLLHNKLVFPYLCSAFSPQDFASIKRLLFNNIET